ncbi:MAG: hypothetical protein COX02_02140 [Candidatus Vogelbacteria bacterium CG22_combo_CG10-13_8_21_14_all_37_9]|uniref:tRNA N6-adenosine threonylcarbamoyltransferase n=1 Tax=Candidatus Vogelbacteria bacterium CG22_combo_CG10-13_8_21_14_all_37_9 TaxID=1975046 RepID=A0A2H0BKN1_9BACT|nr:MAG: hypothetical protein COX02_02140 [Candidatus Vogelbacteria bacterium CG22_combo_CG10-13_8_21_14_all_37_9]
MKILAIETSCDDSAISLVEATGILAKPKFRILAEVVSSQTAIHQAYGGVVPNLAKREHGKNLIPLLLEVFKKSKIKNHLPKFRSTKLKQARKLNKIEKLLERELELKEQFWSKILDLPKPKIDYLAVTAGPGLEPALWVGINLAKALSLLWDIPLLGVNHLEGHLVSVILNQKSKITRQNFKKQNLGGQENKKVNPVVKFPAVGLIISGGHTEIILMKKVGDYKKIGQTRDDAVGEAFDKVARLLGLPYPGGPHISHIAEQASILRQSASSPRQSAIVLPRPMINSKDYDFSFSGLKTAVLYLLPKLGKLTAEIKAEVALEFETAVTEVLLRKTLQASQDFKAKTIIVGGGVIANRQIRDTFKKLVKTLATKPQLLIPAQTHTGDNASMIAGAAYFQVKKIKHKPSLISGQKIKADGNLKL